jgi:predicted 3-demethylubiquinone-9 3-methyltransferase (glyoxalase superfamily)
MQKLVPYLWFDKDAKGITDFYSNVFPGTKVKSNGVLSDTPSGDVEMAGINILGLEFSIITAGPHYKFKPSISFMVICESVMEVESYWHKLIESGVALMEISEYPFAN